MSPYIRTAIAYLDPTKEKMGRKIGFCREIDIHTVRGCSVESIRHNMAQMAETTKDLIIQKAVCIRLGRQLSLESELVERLKILVPQNIPDAEIYILDEQPLVTFYPLRTEQRSNEIRMFQSYQEHGFCPVPCLD